MTLKQYLTAQLDGEAALTRKTVGRAPEGQNGFKPHQRSMELGYLAALVAGMLGGITFMIDRDDRDLSDPSCAGFRPKVVSTTTELLASVDGAVASARRALEGAAEDHLQASSAFKIGGNVVQQQARYLMISDAVFSHLAHHCGQLTAYLRLASSTVPALYGPSADERF
jgi:hypothetical protein